MGCEKNVGIDKFPKQGKWLGKTVEICFNYDTSNTIFGECVRNDNEEPHRTIFKTEDGRYILATECQFSPLSFEKI